MNTGTDVQDEAAAQTASPAKHLRAAADVPEGLPMDKLTVRMMSDAANVMRVTRAGTHTKHLSFLSKGARGLSNLAGKSFLRQDTHDLT